MVDIPGLQANWSKKSAKKPYRYFLRKYALKKARHFIIETGIWRGDVADEIRVCSACV